MVTVEIFSILNGNENNVSVKYRVNNLYNHPIYLVADNWFTYKYEHSLIEIFFVRTKMVEGARVFGYFFPTLEMISPEKFVEKELLLEWPQKLNTIWNTQDYAKPDKGHNKLKIIIGYGFSEKIEEREDLSAEENIQNWQKTSESKEYDITVKY